MAYDHAAYCRDWVKNNREANRAAKKRYNDADKTEETILYYLPEEHYMGITNNLRRRLQKHRRNGKITEGHEVIGRFERHVDAHLVETMFHVRGYNGYQYSHKFKTAEG